MERRGGAALVMDVLQWFADPANWTGRGGALLRIREQLVLTVIAVGAAAAIAIPVGVYAGHVGRYAGIVTAVANLGRAIPTFALLLLFASITAIGVGPAAVVYALVIFAVPPILMNAYTAVSTVDSGVRNAATALGLSGRQRVWQIEVPLGLPLLTAGLRTATVQVAATATLAAFVGGGGLGRLILDGFALQDYTLVWAGILLVAALTMSLEALLALTQRLITRKVRT